MDLLMFRCAWLVVASGAAYAAVVFRRVVLRQRHPLDWPVDLEMMAAGFKVGIRWGNLSTLRLMLGWMAQPALFPHLVVRQVQPPGCEPCYWLSLRSGPQDSAQPDIVLCYVHGGAFVAGHPLMCAATFGRWMRALASQGLHTNVLCVSYPLAPERPFPSAVASTAAAFAWVGQEFPAGCGTTVIAVGDSAGGNIVPAALHALRDYCQQPQPAARLLYTPGASSSSSPESAPAGEARAALSHQPSALVRSNSQAAALTAALEAHLFADLHNRLTVMAVTSMQASTSSSDAGPGEAAAVPASTVRMPSAVILVSPAADISPTASFRSRSLTSSSTSSSPTDAAVAGSSDVASISAAGGAAAVPAAGGTGGGTGSTTSSSSSSRIHYDYLPENIESGGMGSYAEHHEQLCGVFASPVHLPRLDGLCSGRWLVLSGGVELLHPDIERFARKLQHTLGPQQVLFHVEPRLPHSWAILPTPSMASKQDVVVSFIAAEHAAAVAAAERPGAVTAGPSI